MEEIELSFFYCDRNCSLKCNNETKFCNIFPILQQKLDLKYNADQFCCLTPLVTDFDDTAVLQMYKQNKSLEIHIVLKSQYQYINSFLEESWPSMKLEIAMYPVQALQILRELHITHSLSYHIFTQKSLDSSEDFISKSMEKEENLVNKLQIIYDELKNKIRNDETFVCKVCHSEITGDFTVGRPTQKELSEGVNHIEKHTCLHCGSTLRVKRYLDIEKIKQKDYCNEKEVCIVYAAILFKLGCYSRIIVEPVIKEYWLEVWDEKEKRYVHFDPFHGIIDSPLSIESLFSHKLQYAIAVGPNECMDVTVRYCKDPNETIDARNDFLDEELFQQAIGLRAGMWGYQADVIERQEIDYYNMEASLPC